ncbi:MAG: helix-turn-helix transcriptional regulator [Bacteroidales bacterium]|nr:helix-turn-helix transcriptional regulator [Bacteroidales bacterium]
MAPPDREHFGDACVRAFHFLEKLPTEELKEYALSFECRLRNIHEIYQRVLLKFMVLEHTDLVALWLYPVAGANTAEPHRSVYITQQRTRKFMLKEKDCYFCPRELEVASYCRKGYNSQEIADKLFIAKNTVSNHNRRVSQKIGVREIIFASMYLHDLGVI